MVGIPKTKRCQRCKRRKIKCDENWPTCTPCVKSGSECSGPPLGPKFVHNGCHVNNSNSLFELPDGSSSTSSPSSPSPAPGEASTSRGLVSLRTTTATGGGSYRCFTMSSGPRMQPTTVAERVAVRLIGHMERDPYRDVLTNMSYLKYLPNRLASNAALRDCVGLFCSAWANFRRRLPAAQLMDAEGYGRALRSLQRTLNGEQQLEIETLAAITILERCDAFFGLLRPHNRSLHAKGVQTLMIKRGPPKGNDELDLLLTLEAQVALLPFWIVEGGDSFFEEPAWEDATRRAHAFLKTTRPGFERASDLDLYVHRWPVLAKEIQSVHDNPDRVAASLQAADIVARIRASEASLLAIDQELLEEGHGRGIIEHVADETSHLGARTNYTSLDFAQLFLGTAVIRIVMFRMLYDLSLFLGEPDAAVLEQYHALCRRCWMSLPYARRLGPMAAALLMGAWTLTFEVSSGQMREDLLDCIAEIDSYRQRFPQDRAQLDKHIIQKARIIVGYDNYIPSGYYAM